jgi:hypothetical protein
MVQVTAARFSPLPKRRVALVTIDIAPHLIQRTCSVRKMDRLPGFTVRAEFAIDEDFVDAWALSWAFTALAMFPSRAELP